MAEKGFGVKEVNLIGASGTPTITSPNNLNLNANNVAISTNVSIGGTLSVTGNVSVGGTLTYEDVTNIDSVGIITARSDVIVGRGLTVTGISTFSGDVHFSLHGAGNPKIQFDESSDLLWFKKQTTGGSSTKLGLGGGTSYDHLQLQQTYTGGGQSEITAYNSNILISAISAEKNITIQSTNDITLANGVYPFIKCEENSSSDQSITLYYGQTGSTPYANPKLQTTSTGVNVTGAITVNGSALSITPTDSDIQVAYTVTANGSSAYRFAGNGVVSTADNPDLYLIRGQKYRFINNSGGSHPFQIREASGGTAYSTGVTNNGASSGNIDFAPTFDSPAQLVYQCTSHGGMVGNIYLRDAAGNNTNVGVTTFTSSSPIHLKSGVPSIILEDTDGTHGQSIIESNGDNLKIRCDAGNASSGTGSNIRFEIDASERLRIQSNNGDILVGNYLNTTGQPRVFFLSSDGNFPDQLTKLGLRISNGANDASIRAYSNSNSWNHVKFYSTHTGSIVTAGSISQSGGNSIAYNTSSDYRLKENEVAISDGITRLKQLKPYRFNFKSNTSQIVDGFFAHEVSGIVPEAITGEKDSLVTQAMINAGKIDEPIGTPVYQQIDQAKLVPLLTAALQEAITKIETLESEVAALKAK